MIWNRKHSLLLLAAALVGCSDDKTPHYELVATQGGRLPQPLQQDSACTHNLTAAELRLTSDTRYNSSFRILVSCPGKQDSLVPDPGIKQGNYRVFGDTLVLFNVKGGVAGIGVHNADHDSLTVFEPSQAHTLFYVRR